MALTGLSPFQQMGWPQQQPSMGIGSQFPLGAGTLPTFQGAGNYSFSNALSPFSTNFGIAPQTAAASGLPAGVNILAGSLNTNPLGSLSTSNFSLSPLINYPQIGAFQQTGTNPLSALGALDPNLAALFSQLNTGAASTQQTGTAQASDLSGLLAQLGISQTGTSSSIVNTNSFETLLQSLTLANHPSNTKTIKLASYDVNLLRQLGDDPSLGGNGDKTLSKTELAIAKQMVSLISNQVGENNSLKSLKSAANNLTTYFDNLAKVDGKADGISAQDIVVTAQNDTDKNLETLELRVPKSTASTPSSISDLLTSLLGGSGAGTSSTESSLISLLLGQSSSSTSSSNSSDSLMALLLSGLLGSKA